MAGPRCQQNPLGWRGLSSAPAASAGNLMALWRQETAEKIRYNFFGPVYRGDAATLTLLAYPRINTAARVPRSIAGGDIGGGNANR